MLFPSDLHSPSSDPLLAERLIQKARTEMGLESPLFPDNNEMTEHMHLLRQRRQCSSFVTTRLKIEGWLYRQQYNNSAPRF